MLGCIFNLIFWLLALCLMAQLIKCILKIIICITCPARRQNTFNSIKRVYSNFLQKIGCRSHSEVVVQQNDPYYGNYQMDPMYQQQMMYYQQPNYQYSGYQQSCPHQQSNKQNRSSKKRCGACGGCGCGN